MRMRIDLPRDRDRCGRLSLLDDRSRVIFGPVWCAGRASDGAAAGYGNDGRSYLLPYGDTPPGAYKIKKLISMRGASPRAVMQFGRFGAISLTAIDGPAVIADSVGRFEIWIHGGSRDPQGRLRPTNGSLRLADEDVFRLVNLVKGHEGLRVDVREANNKPDAPAVGLDDDTFDEGDPPTLEHIRLPPRQSLAPFPPTTRPAPLHMIFMGEYDGGEAGSENFDVKEGVTLAPDAATSFGTIADDYFEATGQKLTITDGSRDTQDQAQVMFNRLENDTLASYKNKDAENEIRDAYNEGKEAGKSNDEIVADMKSVIDQQVENGVYISNHLQDGAVDVRSHDMTPEQRQAFIDAVTNATGRPPLVEGDHYHVELGTE
jgi:hypothetical protein